MTRRNFFAIAVTGFCLLVGFVLSANSRMQVIFRKILGLAPGSSSPERTFEAMKELVPRGKAHSLHTNMIRFGRTVCRSINPRCAICPLYAQCGFDGKSAPARRSGRVPAAGGDFMLLDNV